MPISATGISTSLSCARSGSRGFTLLELMVVVAIVGIMVGAVVLSLGAIGKDRQVEQEAVRLKSMFDLLREEALMQSRDYGVLFTQTGYRFYIYDYQKLAWVEPTDDRLLKEHALHVPLNLSLTLEDRDLVLEENFEDMKLEDVEPQVMILSSGELTPFEAALYRNFADGRFTLTAGLDGKLAIAEAGFDAGS